MDAFARLARREISAGCMVKAAFLAARADLAEIYKMLIQQSFSLWHGRCIAAA
jgi:hypothetical protein